MSDQFVGCTVSLVVGGGLGFYQGEVTNVSTADQEIKLTKVLHNGKPINKTEVTINAADILDLKILKEDSNPKQMNEGQSNKELSYIKSAADLSQASTVPKSTSFPGDLSSHAKQANQCSQQKNSDLNTTFSGKERVTVDNRTSPRDSNASPSFLPIHSNLDSKFGKDQRHFSEGQAIIKRKSRTSVGELLAHGSHTSDFRDNTESGVSMCGGPASVINHTFGRRSIDMVPSQNLQNKRQWNKQWKNFRDETTFGTPIDRDVLNTDFDFEKNLALFDKQAVMEEIQSLKPDVVRQADRKAERKFRCDESILASKPQPKRQIIVPAEDAGEVIYATDNGLLVPSVSTELRMNLLSTANQNGLTKSRQLEMMGRAATEVIISVIGGSHRLEPGNSHQPPVVVLLCGANAQGAAGVNCGRQLESQGVQTVVFSPPLPSSPNASLLFSHEVQLYAMTSGRVVNNVITLPSTVDLIVDARFDLHGELGVSSFSWLNETNSWASACRAPVVALDPPNEISLPLTPRIRLCPALPLAYPPDTGKVYLLNLNIPMQVFTSLGIKYTSPFGAKMVVPLHPRE